MDTENDLKSLVLDDLEFEAPSEPAPELEPEPEPEPAPEPAPAKPKRGRPRKEEFIQELTPNSIPKPVPSASKQTLRELEAGRAALARKRV